MFTGIVEEIGAVLSIRHQPGAIRLAVRSRLCGRGLVTGQSVAVNGCCLTASRLDGPSSHRRIHFDLLQETWNRTNFHTLQPGAHVNLERALAANGRFDGHIVTGHIDEAAPIKRWEQVGNDWLLEITPSRGLLRLLVFKGSIAVDGISLTVAKVLKHSFQAWIIPQTRQLTRLPTLQAGDLVNLETDLLAKYIDRLLPR